MSARIWGFLGQRPGDNAQVLALAEELRLPFVTKTLRYNRLHMLTGPTTRASLRSLDRPSRSLVQPPWPDLIIAVGRRAVPIARWVCARNQGRTKLVLIGHPRVSPDEFDLVFTTRQYILPEGRSIRLLPVAMSRYRRPPTASAKELAWLGALPRPHLLMMLGGTTRYWIQPPDYLIDVAARLGERADGLGGSLIAVGSARTEPAALDGLDQTFAGHPARRVVRGKFPRFPVLMNEADELFPTADSISMLSESIIAGKPMGIIPVLLDPKTADILGDEAKMRTNPRRDLRRFWNYLRDEGLAGTIDAPIRAQMNNPVIAAAAEVRALLGLEP